MTGDRFNSVTWFVLLVSLGVFFRVPLLGGHELNISLYDIVVPSLFLWTCVRRDKLWVGLGDIRWPALVVAAILAHRYLIEHPIDPTGSMRESAKLVVVVIEVWMLCQIFRDRHFGIPPIWAVSAGFCGALMFAVAEVYREGYGPGSYDALQTVHASVLCGLAVILSIYRCYCETPRQGAMILVASILPLALFAMVAKIYLIVGSAVSAYLVVGFRLRPSSKMVIALGGLAAMLGAAAIVLFGSVYFRDYPPFSYMQGVLTSLGFRLYLWEGAWSAFLDRFPNGLGAGQYGAYMNSLSSPILFTHNTFLGLLVEFGALGVLLVFGLLYLIARSIRHWPFPIMLIVLVFLIVPMLFHDVLGLRIYHVVLALGLTAAGRWRQKASGVSGTVARP